MKSNTHKNRGLNAKKFSTFGGVFTPSLLTILGVIMFLRLSTVTGYAGLWNGFIIIAAAKTISLITGLSVSSISTNMRVKGGGAYYLISRSLGIEFGGVIAVFFYIAQAIAVALYVIGFTEALFSAFPDIEFSFRMIATITNMIVFICVFIGAGWTIRIQYGILAVLGLSLLSFFIGAGIDFSPDILSSNLAPAWTERHSFFTVFALFFPAVTGIMAGVNMSGDLKDPSRSIPNGTLASIGVSALIYFSITFLFSGSVTRPELLGEGFVMKNNALLPALIYAGVIAATLSSALGSMMGAPRILQAFSRDNIFKRLKWFGRGSGVSGEPRNAIILTFIIAQISIIAGDLDTIAPIITMFFLLTYGTINLACFREIRSKNPSFRPTFRFNHWAAALAGALGCIGVMLLINMLWAVIAIILSGLLYGFIARSQINVKWGDLESGMAYQNARDALLRLERERYHPKNWRPSILALSGGAYNRLHLAEYACWLAGKSGMVSIGQIISGKLEKLMDRRHEAESILRKFILREKLSAFGVVIVEENILTAIQALLQCHGIGGLKPNTVLLGWSQDPAKAGTFHKALCTIKKMKRSILIIASKQKQEKTFIPDGVINIWWDTEENFELMLLLAFMLQKSPEWQGRDMRIIRTVPPKADAGSVENELRVMLEDARIEADIVVIRTDNPLKAVRRAIKPSAVLFTGFNPGDDASQTEVISRLQCTVKLPGDIILVYSAGDVSLKA